MSVINDSLTTPKIIFYKLYSSRCARWGKFIEKTMIFVISLFLVTKMLSVNRMLVIINTCSSYLFWGVLVQQVVQQTGVFQP